MKWLAHFAIFLLAASMAGPAPADGLAPAAQEARAIVKQFATALKGALKGAIEEHGFEHAIGVCKLEAPEIATRLSRDTGWQVARTALRMRNPNNTPSAEERAVLEQFLARSEAGEPLATMEYTAEITRQGRRGVHYMKAIPVAELCTACHGTEINPDLGAAIRARYPQDQATGFKVGDLRGAFALFKPLE